MKSRFLLPAVLFACSYSAFVWSHPLGNFSMNQYTVIDLRGEVPLIHWQMDFAEIPTYKELDLLDVDRNDQFTEAEMSKYADKRLTEWLGSFMLQYQDQSVALLPIRQSVRIEEPQSGEPVLQLEYTFVPKDWHWSQEAESHEVEFRSKVYDDAQGYREAKIYLDERFSINLGPWEDELYRYLQPVKLDDKLNPIFQSYYNCFLMELGPMKSDAIDISEDRDDFSWTATAQAQEEAGKKLATFEKAFAPGEWQPLPLQEVSPGKAEIKKMLEDLNPPQPVKGPLSVVKPKKSDEQKLYSDGDREEEETLKPVQVIDATVGTGFLLVIAAVVLVLIRAWRKTRSVN